MLYELLAGRPPYWPYWTGAPDATHAAVLERVRAGPPEPLARLAPWAPAELLSIAARAMAREPAARYAGMAALEADLRAFLEDRVVRAHATGPLAELEKWVARNRRFAGALFLALLTALGGLAAAAAVGARGRARLDVQADLFRLPYLEAEAERLWPEAPATIPAYEDWVATADALVARLGVHRAALAELRERALVPDAAELAAMRARSPLAGELAAAELVAADLAQRLAAAEGTERQALEAERAGLEARRAELESTLADLRSWRFALPADQLRHDALEQTVARLEAFADPERGLLADVRARLAFARAVEARTLVEPAAAWERARAAAAAAGPAAPYRGLALEPILGLVPLGPDPRSGLEEFALPRSGAVPVRGADGGLALDGESALVLVLVPGGSFHLGAQASDPAAPGFDREARPEEGPVREVALGAFLIGKHELTQGQWARLGGGRPSAAEVDGGRRDEHPVDGVSWNECRALLARFGLSLPTEAQWEYAARAGSVGPFLGLDDPPGDPRGLAGAVNLADATVLEASLGWPQARGMEWLDDGHARHAPVGTYAPNAFGLHDVLGNVWEWCLDEPGPYGAPLHSGTGLRVADPSGERVARGGGYVNNASFARVSIRDLGRSADFDSGYHGLRPARSLAP
jgi:formylglycine-generating enzyme required for sulfatase activity